jgi:hypothetical protein
MDINVSTSTKENVMSQKVNEKQNPNGRVTSKQKVQEPPITCLSPDDDVGVKPGDGTGQPGQIER